MIKYWFKWNSKLKKRKFSLAILTKTTNWPCLSGLFSMGVPHGKPKSISRVIWVGIYILPLIVLNNKLAVNLWWSIKYFRCKSNKNLALLLICSARFLPRKTCFNYQKKKNLLPWSTTWSVIIRSTTNNYLKQLNASLRSTNKCLNVL